MTKITISEAIRSQLLGLDSELELCDESGRTLGCFVPALALDDHEDDWARARCSEEDWDETWSEPGG
jgi:hypothetical protein